MGWGYYRWVKVGEGRMAGWKMEDGGKEEDDGEQVMKENDGLEGG